MPRPQLPIPPSLRGDTAMVEQLVAAAKKLFYFKTSDRAPLDLDGFSSELHGDGKGWRKIPLTYHSPANTYLLVYVEKKAGLSDIHRRGFLPSELKAKTLTATSITPYDALLPFMRFGVKEVGGESILSISHLYVSTLPL